MDVAQRKTLLLSTGFSSGKPGNGASGPPRISPDGTVVVFRSAASDLVSGDYNGHADWFQLSMALDDSDHDGLPDDWEVAFFGNLSRDGTGDFDRDGVSDADEFAAGTDPTGISSVLRVLTLQEMTASKVVLLWPADPNAVYRVEFRESAERGDWTSIAEGLIFKSGAGRWEANKGAASGRTFYRVVRN